MNLADVLFPRWCAGCGEPDNALCIQCEELFAGPWHRCEESARYLVEVTERGEVSPFPVYALAHYRDGVAAAIVHWKNSVDIALDRCFDAVIERGCAMLTWTMFPAMRRDGHGRAQVLIVPMPSARSRQRAGTAVVERCAQSYAAYTGWSHAEVLAKSTRGYDRGRSSRARAAGIHARGAKKWATIATEDVRGCDVVLIDDVMTTGATLSGGARAIRQAGGRVIGALVLAVVEQRQEKVS